MRHISLFPWLVGITGALIHSGVLRLRLFRAEGPLPEGAALASSPCSRTRLADGQHQRLALAWVLLAGFPVVVLDEPAEHLDEETAGQQRRRRVPGTPPHQVPRKIGWRLSVKAFRPSR